MRRYLILTLLPGFLLAILFSHLWLGCEDDDSAEAIVNVIARFALNAMNDDFFAIPFPSFLRQNEDGKYDLSSFPDPWPQMVP